MIVFSLSSSIVFAKQLTVNSPYQPVDIKVMYNGEEIVLKHKPVKYNEFLLLPAREVFNALGYDAKWDSPSQMMSVTGNGISAIFSRNDDSVIKNGIQYPGVTPSVLVNGSFYIEATQLGASVDCGVNMDGDNTLVIYPPDADEQAVEEDAQNQSEEQPQDQSDVQTVDYSNVDIPGNFVP